jgi:hypothetical protein
MLIETFLIARVIAHVFAYATMFHVVANILVCDDVELLLPALLIVLLLCMLLVLCSDAASITRVVAVAGC